MELPKQSELDVDRLGEGRFPSPLIGRGVPFMDDDNRVLLTSETSSAGAYVSAGEMPPSFEQAGPRRDLFFDPPRMSCGIVTCGGLCPGLNDVIRSIVMTLTHGYGVSRIVGFRYGYAGLARDCEVQPRLLTPDDVLHIHEHGGTLLGSSRGEQDPQGIVDTLVSWRIGVLFAIGGDGTLRGAAAIAEEIRNRNLPIAVIAVPKTIDNDLEWIARSFGFITAVHESRPAILAAHAEALGARNGVGLVKLMGRHSGFIAAHASLANADVNFCLVPEAPFTLRGEGGFLPVLLDRLERRRHAVVVVAEGAGQELFRSSSEQERDASGNARLGDIGVFLREEIKAYGAEKGVGVRVKYIDPSYTIRSQPANSNDSAYCLVLGQNAVHAGMAGRTNMVVGYWNTKFTHVPLVLSAGRRKQIDPDGELWQYVLQMTGQPASMVGR